VSCSETARALVLRCADEIRSEASRISVLRSVDATESAQWLREIAQAMREACGPDDSEGEK
jgi:hypothetical protein